MIRSVPVRKRGSHLRVPVLPEEAQFIRERAHSCGLSVAGYLRNLGLGVIPESLEVPKAAQALWQIHEDLQRISSQLSPGSLCTSASAGDLGAQRVFRVLEEIRRTQATLLSVAQRL